MKLIKLRDQLGVLRPFTGEILLQPDGSATTYSTWERGRHRWVEMTVYRHQDGGYVLHRNGRSQIVHRVNGKCEHVAGWATTDIDDLPDGAVPCTMCLPKDELVNGTATYYWAEADRPIVSRCQRPEDLITVLTEKRAGSKEAYLSRPATEILKLAARADPQIETAWHGTEIPI